MINAISWGPTPETAIRAFEEEIGFPLPADYRQFIATNNGCQLNKQVFFVKDLDQDIMAHVFYGITSPESRSLTVRYWLNEYEDEIPEKTLLFGSDKGGGFLMYVTEGENRGVYYWDYAHFFPQSSDEEGNTYFLAKSFAEFCDSLLDYTPTHSV